MKFIVYHFIFLNSRNHGGNAKRTAREVHRVDFNLVLLWFASDRVLERCCRIRDFAEQAFFNNDLVCDTNPGRGDIILKNVMVLCY